MFFFFFYSDKARNTAVVHFKKLQGQKNKKKNNIFFKGHNYVLATLRIDRSNCHFLMFSRYNQVVEADFFLNYYFFFPPVFLFSLPRPNRSLKPEVKQQPGVSEPAHCFPPRPHKQAPCEAGRCTSKSAASDLV